MDSEGNTTPQSTLSIPPSSSSKKRSISSSNLRQSSITESFTPVAIQSLPSTVNDVPHDNNPSIVVEPNIATRPKTSITHTSILETSVPSNSSIVDNDSPPAVVVASKKAKSTPHDRKSKKTMLEWVQEALLAMKDRTGSSHHAIFKYILTEGASVFMDTPTIRSRFNQTLKQAVARGQLVKIKASYKLSLEWIKKENMKRASTATRQYMEQRKRDELRKNGMEDHTLQSDITTQQPGKLKETKKMQQMKRLEQQRIKEEKERLEKERLERIKRRRFPIEDTRLHQEDKEFGIPSTLPRAPPIPFFFQLTRDSKSTAMTPSRCDFTDMESRGIVPDLIQIFHFFQGHVGFAALMKPKIVCDFTFRHLLYAVDEILMGNARKSKLVPPLLQHLMLCCLTVLTNPTTEGETLAQKQFNKDLLELKEALGPASWPEVCCMYMDCTDRYYKSSASQDPSVLPPGVTDLHYLFRVNNSPDWNLVTSTHDTIPEGYYGYLGHPQSSLAKAHEKLTRQDAWLLNAEELLALLRALTDDILATNPLLATEISNR
jgi:linker histone H1 and H5 family